MDFALAATFRPCGCEDAFGFRKEIELALALDGCVSVQRKTQGKAG